MIKRAADGKDRLLMSESEDDESDEQDDENASIQQKFKSDQEPLRIAKAVQSNKSLEGKFYPQDEVMVTKNNVQCIVQGQGRQPFKIKKGDILSVELDLIDLNLVQCKAYN